MKSREEIQQIVDKLMKDLKKLEEREGFFYEWDTEELWGADDEIEQ